MKQQILIIHGGHSAGSYKKYLSYLKKKSLTLRDLRFQGWKATLGKKLGSGYEVFSPRMPNPQMARYLEWKIWFEKVLKVLDSGVVLIGHSLGGVFLAKYLSEEKPAKKVRATFLVSAPYLRKEFALPQDLKNMIKRGGKIFLYHSKDDNVVPFADFKKYQRALPDAVVRTFKNRGHLHQEKLPEIITDIRALSRL